MICSYGRCADGCADATARNDFLGCDYWAVSTLHSLLSINPALPYAVSVTNPQAFTVHVHIDLDPASAPIDTDLAPFAANAFDLPWVDALAQRGGSSTSTPDMSALVRSGAYHVLSSAPVAVQQFNPLTPPPRTDNETLGSSLLLATPSLGTDYVVAVSGDRARLSYELAAFATIIGTVDSTRVDVTLTAAIRASADGTVAAHGPGTASFTIGRGDVLELVAAGTTSGAMTCDPASLTGTTIHASHPIAVISGQDAANLPCEIDAADHEEEQLLPTTAWGTRFAVPEIVDRGPGEPFFLRIVAGDTASTVTFDPTSIHPAATIASHSFLEFEGFSDFEFNATAPVEAMEFMLGRYAYPVDSGIGDPAAVVVVPRDRYRDRYDFYVPDSFVAQYVGLAVPASAAIVLDGAPVDPASAMARPLGSSGDQAWTILLTAGAHHISSSDGRAFGGHVYGVAFATGYMFPLGVAPVGVVPE